jgi:hypothetical protein
MQNAKFLFILLICRFAFAPSFVRKLACRDWASHGNLSLPTSLHKIGLPILIGKLRLRREQRVFTLFAEPKQLKAA